MNIQTVDDMFAKVFADRNEWVQKKERELLDIYMRSPRLVSKALQSVGFNENHDLTKAVLLRDHPEIGRLTLEHLKAELGAKAFQDALDQYEGMSI